jgi:hypothetical protein
MASHFRLTLAVLVLAAVWLSSDTVRPGAPASADGPCDAVINDPTPPIGGGEPDIVGTITDDNTHSGISGATVQLFRCLGGIGVQVGNATSGSSGGYAFDDLYAPAWYYVQVPLTGPLSGMSPSGGTLNPSAPVDLADGAVIDLSFE